MWTTTRPNYDNYDADALRREGYWFVKVSSGRPVTSGVDPFRYKPLNRKARVLMLTRNPFVWSIALIPVFIDSARSWFSAHALQVIIPLVTVMIIIEIFVHKKTYNPGWQQFKTLLKNRKSEK